MPIRISCIFYSMTVLAEKTSKAPPADSITEK